MPLLMRDLFAAVPCLRPLKVGWGLWQLFLAMHGTYQLPGVVHCLMAGRA